MRSPSRSTTRPSLVALGCILTAAGASAQWGGGMGYNRGGYASTAGQAAAYGMSEMARARGAENLQNSEAAKNWQEAKTLDIQNRARWTETYFDMRKENRDRRSEEAGPRVTQEQAIRMARMAAPPRLGSTQLDPVTGHIEYPLILTDDSYAAYRDRLDSLFAHRAETGGSIQFSDYQAIQQTVSKFVDALKQRVKDYPAGDYGRARTFLDSLAHEATMPAG